MQKIIYYCDKCGKEIRTKRYRLELIEVGTDTAATSFDICSECEEELKGSIALPPPLAEKRKKKRLTGVKSWRCTMPAGR